MFGEFEPERFLIAQHDAEHEHRHKAAGLHAVRAHVSADHRHQGDHRGKFGEEAKAFVGDQEGGQIAECPADEDTEERLFKQVGDGSADRKLARAHCHAQHGKSEYRAHRVVER